MFCSCLCFFFKQKTAYEMRISDWSSDVCSSDLPFVIALPLVGYATMVSSALRAANRWLQSLVCTAYPLNGAILLAAILAPQPTLVGFSWAFLAGSEIGAAFAYGFVRQRSEDHTSELQSLMRNTYAVFCLKKKK